MLYNIFIESEKDKEMFEKYRSLVNHYAANPLTLDLDQLVSVGEKLDGSNFSIMVDGEAFEFASRNQLVDSTWNNLIELVPQDLLQEMVDFSTNTGMSITLYGEVFSSKILKRIPYGEARIRFFEACIGGDYVSGKEFHTLMGGILHYQKYTVPVKVMTLREALGIDVEEFYSDFADSIAEGVVIKSWHSTSLSNRVTCIKFKSKKFSEMTGAPKIKKRKEYSMAQLKFAEYVNTNRVLSYFSKEGELSDMKQMGAYIKAILEDAYEDFETNLIEEERMVIDKKTTIAPYGGIVAKLIKEQLGA